MPTLYKPELTEAATPWLKIWERMFASLKPNAREILAKTGFYAIRDIAVPLGEGPLSDDELAELSPIISALTRVAVESEEMRDGILAATLKKLAKAPHLFSMRKTPAAVQWELARNYRRYQEKPGTFAMDIWGSKQTQTSYVRGDPIPENIARAAEMAATRIAGYRSPGRPKHTAHRVLADHLGPIFRASGQKIVRSREKQIRYEQGEVVAVYVETGRFHKFLELVLQPLKEFLRERCLAPVTIETIVRMTDNRAHL